jgi:excinuclease ABC subunit C
MIVAGPEGFRKKDYRKFNIRSADLAPGDDYGMMREVLARRFRRLIAESPRDERPLQGQEARGPCPTPIDPEIPDQPDAPVVPPADATPRAATCEELASPWPDVVLIDGGLGQLNAARETLASLGITDLPLIAIAKGPDRDAGRETFFVPLRPPFNLKDRDPVLYFVQRLRDEAHRFAIGSHRQRRKRDLREAGLQEIPGIGPTRKRALLRHFGTLRAIERAAVADLEQVPGINAETARKVYDFFHRSVH